MQGWARRYGDCFTLSILPVGRLVVVTDPAALRKLFTGDPSVFRAGEATARLLPSLGAGSILLADGDEHMRRRRRLLPLFHGESLAAQTAWITEIAERELERWPVGRRLSVLPGMRRIAFQVIARFVLGSLEPGRTAELHARLARMLSGTAVLASWYPWPARRGAPRGPWAEFERRVRTVDALLLEQIRGSGAARARGEPGDVLSLLLGEGGERSEALTERELCDELRSLLIVGHETTASALAWAVAELARAPAVLGRLLAELEGGDRRYLEAVLEETLRLHAPVVDAVRLLAEPVELGGFTLPAGSIVLAALPLVHRRPELYADPESFLPERFLEGRPDPYAFVPFGGGVRRCLGAALALHELRIVLPLVLRRFRLRPARPEPEQARLVGTMLVPARGAELILERRRRGQAGRAGTPRRLPV
jgi:cytochrome P450